MIQSTVGMLGIFAGLGLGITATKYVAELRSHDPERAGRIIALGCGVAVWRVWHDPEHGGHARHLRRLRTRPHGYEIRRRTAEPRSGTRRAHHCPWLRCRD